MAILVGTVCLLLAGVFGSMVYDTWKLGWLGMGAGVGTLGLLMLAVPSVLVGLGLLIARVRPYGVRVFVLWSVVALVGMVVVRLVQLRSY